MPAGRSLQRSSRVPVEGDERVGLQPREGQVLGVVGGCPAQLIRQFPGHASEHGVTEEPDLQPGRSHAPEEFARFLGRQLASVHRLVQADTLWERRSVGARSSCFAGILRRALAMWMTAVESTTNLVIARSYARRAGPEGLGNASGDRRPAMGKKIVKAKLEELRKTRS